MGDLRFTIFESWADAFDQMSDEDLGKAFRMMYRHAFKGEEPEEEWGMARLAYQFVVGNIDASVNGQRNGSKGGRPRKANAETTDKTTPETPSKTPRKTPSETHAKTPSETTVSENAKPYEYEYEMNKEVNMKGEGDYAPARKEVEEFFKANGSTKAQGAKFHRHYSSQGWLKGNGLPVSDWRSVAQSWIAEDTGRDPEAVERAALEWPPTLPCPSCGSEAVHTGGGVYHCDSCDGFGRSWRAGEEVAS